MPTSAPTPIPSASEVEERLEEARDDDSQPSRELVRLRSTSRQERCVPKVIAGDDAQRGVVGAHRRSLRLAGADGDRRTHRREHDEVADVDGDERAVEVSGREAARELHAVPERRHPRERLDPVGQLLDREEGAREEEERHEHEAEDRDEPLVGVGARGHRREPGREREPAEEPRERRQRRQRRA